MTYTRTPQYVHLYAAVAEGRTPPSPGVRPTSKSLGFCPYTCTRCYTKTPAKGSRTPRETLKGLGVRARTSSGTAYFVTSAVDGVGSVGCCSFALGPVARVVVHERRDPGYPHPGLDSRASDRVSMRSSAPINAEFQTGLSQPSAPARSSVTWVLTVARGCAPATACSDRNLLGSRLFCADRTVRDGNRPSRPTHFSRNEAAPGSPAR